MHAIFTDTGGPHTVFRGTPLGRCAGRRGAAGLRCTAAWRRPRSAPAPRRSARRTGAPDTHTLSASKRLSPHRSCHIYLLTMSLAHLKRLDFGRMGCYSTRSQFSEHLLGCFAAVLLDHWKRRCGSAPHATGTAPRRGPLPPAPSHPAPAAAPSAPQAGQLKHMELISCICRVTA